MVLYNYEKFSFYHWLTVSLVLHVSIITLPLMLTSVHIQDRHRDNKLAIELFGIIADRQQEERRGGTGVVPRKATQQNVARQQVKKAVPKRSPDTHKAVAADTPVYEEKVDDKPQSTDKARERTGASTTSLPAASGSPGDGVQQRQLTIGYEGGHESTLKQYLTKVAKKIQTHISYPKEMKTKGVEGVSWIAFVIMQSGEIREGSLEVYKSSGYAAFDSSAMESVRKSTPFEKPSEELPVNVAISFDVEIARPRSMR